MLVCVWVDFKDRDYLIHTILVFTGVIYCRVLVKKCPGYIFKSAEIHCTCHQLWSRSCYFLSLLLLFCVGGIESHGLSISLHLSLGTCSITSFGYWLQHKFGFVCLGDTLIPPIIIIQKISSNNKTGKGALLYTVRSEV